MHFNQIAASDVSFCGRKLLSFFSPFAEHSYIFSHHSYRVSSALRLEWTGARFGSHSMPLDAVSTFSYTISQSWTGDQRNFVCPLGYTSLIHRQPGKVGTDHCTGCRQTRSAALAISLLSESIEDMTRCKYVRCNCAVTRDTCLVYYLRPSVVRSSERACRSAYYRGGTGARERLPSRGRCGHVAPAKVSSRTVKKR